MLSSHAEQKLINLYIRRKEPLQVERSQPELSVNV